MYEKQPSAFFDSSCTAFGQNLILKDKTLLQSNVLASLDVDSVNVLRFDWSGEQPLFRSSSQLKIEPLAECISQCQFSITETIFFKFQDVYLFAILSTHGLHVYDGDLSKCVFTKSIKQLCDQMQMKLGDLSLGGLNSLQNLLFVGCSTGDVLIYEINCIDKSVKQAAVVIKFRESVQQHQQPITHINSLVDQIVDTQGQGNQIHRLSIADAFGNVSVWHLDGTRLNLIVTFAGFNNFPCICTRFYQDLLLTAYVSGHIRIYSLIDKQLLCEVSAHARPITSLDIAIESGLLMTTSEDTFVRVWQLKPANNQSISHLFCVNLENLLLTAGLFLDAEGRYFSVIAYDESELLLFKRIDS